MSSLAEIVAQANIVRLSLIGLAKNTGKTTTAKYLLATLPSTKGYRLEDLALTSLGLDGEEIDLLTGLPKPRYILPSGLLIATAETCLAQAETQGARFDRLLQLPGRCALGPLFIARVLRSGPVVIAGPTLLRELSHALDCFQGYGARFQIVDGAINRLGAASRRVTDACILCTGASVGISLEDAVDRTVAALIKLSVPKTLWSWKYTSLQAGLSVLIPAEGEVVYCYSGPTAPASKAAWLCEQKCTYSSSIFMLRQALTEELACALLVQEKALACKPHEAELVVEDATKIFCPVSQMQQLEARGWHIRVAFPLRILAITVNPLGIYPTQHLLNALEKKLSREHPPLFDIRQ